LENGYQPAKDRNADKLCLTYNRKSMKKLLYKLIRVISYSCMGILGQLLLVGLCFANDDPQEAKSIHQVAIEGVYENASLAEVFADIESKSDYIFTYDNKNPFLKERYSRPAGTTTLANVLKDISRTSKLVFQQVNNNISVRRQKAEEKAEPPTVIISAAINVSGRVTSSSDGQGIPGVNILVKGTGTGTVTDVDGNYTVDVPNDEDVLVFSSIGYLTQEVPVNGRSSIDVVLTEDMQSLDEVVVVGYGTQSREAITTSVSKLDNEVLENIPYANPASAMQGTLPGVRVQSTSGQPGASPNIVVRGGTSIDNPSGASPLYVVDGVIRPHLEGIASEDIESLQVLKDAAATAIYGARGSNGVVVVTTKSGKSGETIVSYRYNFTVAQPERTLDLANARDYITMARRGMLGLGNGKYPNNTVLLNGAAGMGTGNDLTTNTAFTTQYLTPENEHKLNEGWESMTDPIDPSRTIIFQDTDWQDVIFRTAFSNNHHINISGGSEKSVFNAGLGYMDSEGTVITTDFKRFTFNLNGDIEIKDNLSFSGRAAYARMESDAILPRIDQIFARAIGMPPTMKYRFEDGTMNPGESTSNANPEYRLRNRNGSSLNQNLTLAAGAEWNILPGLSFSPQVSMFSVTGDSRDFIPTYLRVGREPNITREAMASNSRRTQIQADAVFNYATSFGDHNLDATGGFSYFDRNQSSFNATGQGAASDLIPTLNASSEAIDVFSFITDQVIVGYFGRVQYNYDLKYLLSLTTRYDGASNLGKEHKWGFFPGVSAGWNLHHEEFWDEIFPENLLSLKLRGSYGVNGNIGNLEDFAAQGQYTLGTRYDGTSAVINTIIPNPDLKWERSKTLDFGADIGFFDGRIKVLVDYYRRVTDDLITDLVLPPSTGFGGILTNLGSLENKGFEFGLDAQLIPYTSDFQWDVSLNAAHVKNTILSLPPNGTENNRIGGYYVWDTAIEDYAWKGGLQEGGTMGDMYSYYQTHVYPTDEAAQAPGEPVDTRMSVADRTKFGGDAAWLDKDNNGLIDSRDKVFMGNAFPEWTGGFSNSFSYKNFYLSSRFDFALGHTVFNYTKEYMDGGYRANGNLTQDMVENSWKEPGDIAKYPVYSWYSVRGQANMVPSQSSQHYYEKGDYLAVREITLSYNFPSDLLERLNIKSFRLNLTGNNLHYFTSFTGFSPEVGPEENGRHYGAYPLPRSVILGANISL
jgi:TonB-linked SusC/RagA family outer membrane protein